MGPLVLYKICSDDKPNVFWKVTGNISWKKTNQIVYAVDAAEVAL